MKNIKSDLQYYNMLKKASMKKKAGAAARYGLRQYLRHTGPGRLIRKANIFRKKDTIPFHMLVTTPAIATPVIAGDLALLNNFEQTQAKNRLLKQNQKAFDEADKLQNELEEYVQNNIPKQEVAKETIWDKIQRKAKEAYNNPNLRRGAIDAAAGLGGYGAGYGLTSLFTKNPWLRHGIGLTTGIGSGLLADYLTQNKGNNKDTTDQEPVAPEYDETAYEGY